MLARTKILIASFFIAAAVLATWLLTLPKAEKKVAVPMLQSTIQPTSLFQGQPHASSTQSEMGRYIKRLQSLAVATSTVSFNKCAVSTTVSRIFFAGAVTFTNPSGPVVKLSLGKKTITLEQGAQVRVDTPDLVGIFSHSGFAYSIYAYECDGKFQPISFITNRPI